MRWIVGTTLVLILVLHTGGPLVCAQKQQARPADVEPVRSYVSPSALKSVEIGDYYLRRKKLNAALSFVKDPVPVWSADNSEPRERWPGLETGVKYPCHAAAAGTGVICETWALEVAVIPAKAGIHSASFRK